METAGDCYIVSAGIMSQEPEDGFLRTLDTHDHIESARRVMVRMCVRAYVCIYVCVDQITAIVSCLS